MSRRTWLVSISIVGHLAIGAALYISGIWELEKLESDHRLAGIGVMTPTQSMGGSPAALPEPKFQKKEKTEKKVVKDVQWDKRVERDDAKEAAVATTSGTGNGQGDGEGDQIGDGRGPGGGLCAPGASCVGAALPPMPEPPPIPEPKVVIVPPHAMAALRTDGDTQIRPSAAVKAEILHDGKTRVVGTVKLCISTTGAIYSATIMQSTKYPAYDQQLLQGVKRWRYRPFTINGKPAPACSPVSFVYTIR